MLGCKPSPIPIEPEMKITINEDSPQIDRGRFQRLVRRLIYLSQTIPEIAFVVGTHNQFL